MPPELLRAEDAEEALWPEHVAALEAFAVVSTQWRIEPRFGAATRWLGLDYAAAEAGLRLAGIEVTPGLWADIRQIEQGAKAALNGD
ncbi:hypothetical protein CDZ95_10340 [Mameliella alba]|nr:DUF1799 domain-containing protein [Mameliella alba]OWV43183.1 hypothetical protein CDZ95_10340 [Mameliella alba]OWV58328.1 hypothetical protein CDZ98_15015 [Mameliella alba]